MIIILIIKFNHQLITCSVFFQEPNSTGKYDPLASVCSQQH